MMVLTALALLQSAYTTTTTGPILQPLPRRVEAAISAYHNCLMDVIDGQDRRAAWSERAVLSACAVVRRAKYGEAIARLNRAGWSPSASRRRVSQRFSEQDELVWTIVGHIRVRHRRG